MIALPSSWKLALVAVAVAIAAGAMVWAFSEGKDAARADHLEKTIQTQRSMSDADARGPRTPDDVDRRLRDGTF